MRAWKLLLLGLVAFPVLSFSGGVDKPELVYLVVDRSKSIQTSKLEEPIRKAIEEYIATKPVNTEVRLKFFSTDASRVKSWRLMTNEAKGEFSRYFKKEFDPRGWTRLFDTVGEVLAEATRDAGNYSTIDIKILSDGRDEGMNDTLQSEKFKSWKDLAALGWNLKQSNEKAFIWWVTLDVPLKPEEEPPPDGPFRLEKKPGAGKGFSLQTIEAAFDVWPTTVAPGQDITVSQNYTPGTIERTEWDLGDKTATNNVTRFTHRYARPGSYDIVLRVTGPGGTATVAKRVTVADVVPLKAVFAVNLPRPPKVARVGEEIQLLDQSEGRPEALSWGLGPYGTSTRPSPSFTPSKEGEVTVELIVTRGKETSSAKKNIKVLPLLPDPAFNMIPPTETVCGDKVQLKALDRRQGLTHSWTIHGPDLKGEVVGWLATTTGLFRVTHSVEGPGGTAYAEKPIYVRSPNAPSADFTREPKGILRIGDKVTLRAVKSPPGSVHKWVIGDQDFSGPSVIWEAVSAGSFTATHSVTVPGAPAESLSKDLAVFPPPPQDVVNSDFDISPAAPVKPGASVIVTAVEKRTEFLHEWFLDGERLSASEPVVSLTAGKEGSHVVRHLVTGKGAKSDLIQKSFFVADVLAARFTVRPRLVPGAAVVFFRDQSSGNVASWRWDFGDGRTSDVQNPSHGYWNGGLLLKQITPRLVVRGPDGSESMDPGDIHIRIIPVWWIIAAGILAFLALWVFVVVPLVRGMKLKSLRDVVIVTGQGPDSEVVSLPDACRRHRWRYVRKIFGLTPFATFAVTGRDIELKDAVQLGELVVDGTALVIHTEASLTLEEKGIKTPRVLNPGDIEYMRTDGTMAINLTDVANKPLGDLRVQDAQQAGFVSPF